jgi:hypothetical protein
MRAHGAGWIGRLLTLGLTVVTLTACLPAGQSAVTFDVSTERPVLLLALCRDERVEAVRLAAVEDHGAFYEERETVWRVEAHPPQAVTQVVLGEVPQGFEVVTPIAAELPADLVFVAELTGGTVSETETGPFTVGEVSRDDIKAVRDELRQGAKVNCTSSFAGSLGLPAWLDWVGVAALGSALLVGVWRAMFRRRSRAAVGTSPGSPTGPRRNGAS